MTDLGALGLYPDTNYSEASGVSADGSVIVGFGFNGTVDHAFKIIGTSITDLGALGLYPNSNSSRATAVSADGTVIIGYGYNGTTDHAFKVIGTTMTDLGALGLDPDNNFSRARGISADGSIIVGYSYNGSVNRAFKYVGTTMTDLGALGAIPTHYSYATGVSADGTVIVGESDTGITTHAFKVVGTTMTDLGALGLDPDNNHSLARGVSADGTVIIGDSYNGMVTHAFKVIGTTMTDLGALGLDPENNYSYANGVSADGTVIVGYSYNGTRGHAFKVVGTTMTDLGALRDQTYYSRATMVSAYGSVIVGFSQINDDEGEHAFKYVGTTMIDLGALGTDPDNDSYARAVSADGYVIVGVSDNGIEDHAFIYADNVMLDVVEWMASISGPAGVLPMLNSLSSMPMEGAHHRPLMSYDAMGKTRQSWVTGDFGSSSRKSDSATTTGEAGVSGTFGEVVAGLAVGYGSQNNDLLFGGSSNVTGQYLLGEVDYRLADKQSILSLTAIVGTWKSDTLRGYAIGGGGTDYSRGTTDLSSASVRLRLDGPAMKFGVVPAFTPFASFTWGHTSADAYSETGGSFDAQFDKQTHTSREARLGLTTKHALGADTTLLATAELIHRFDDSQSGFTGTDIDHGALPFSVAGAAITRNQALFGFDIDHKLSADTLLNVSIHFTGIGEAPDVSGAISIRRAF